MSFENDNDTFNSNLFSLILVNIQPKQTVDMIQIVTESKHTHT